MTMPANADVETHGEQPKSPVANRRGRRWLVGLLAIAAGVLAAPTVICKTPLKNAGLAAALRAAAVDGRATIGSLSMGWFSPLSVADFELRDELDQRLASIPAVSIDKSLMDLLFDRSDLGHLRVDQPAIDVTFKAKPAEVEEVVAPELAKAEKKAGNVGFEVEIVNGTVTVHDPAAKREWTLERVMIDLKRTRADGEPVRIALAAAMPSAGTEHLGQFKVAARLQPVRPWLLEIDAGRAIDHVRVTPEMCDAWLKYALPVLADVTESQGEFSLDLEGGRIPLASPATGQTAGMITLHTVDVGPGPLAEQFLSAVATLAEAIGVEAAVQPRQLNLARESQVEFRLVDGRVYHRGLRLELPRMSIETYGWVGFDQSLAMMAEIRLSDPKLLKGPLAALLTSKPLQLPIGGTLKKPVIDTHELRSSGRQALRDTAKELIGNKVERELDRLLRRKSQQ